ncbi:MAG: hypothetical protein AAF202_07195 [Pseudomonadota bacterium]
MSNVFWPEMKNLVVDPILLEVELVSEPTLWGWLNWHTLHIVVQGEEPIEVCSAGSNKHLNDHARTYKEVIERSIQEGFMVYIDSQSNDCSGRLEPVDTVF